MNKCDYGNWKCGRIGHDCAFCYVTAENLCNTCENTYPECSCKNVKFGCDVDTPQRLRENRDNIFYCDKYRERKRKQTNADRIRSMSDEELADFLCKVKADYQWEDHEFPSEEECGEWEEWLQSEVEG